MTGSPAAVFRHRERSAVFQPFPMMFHPTLLVRDLDVATSWFGRVFDRPPVRWEEKWDLDLLNPDYPINYSYFFVVGDVSIDVLCPALLTLPGDRSAVYPDGEGLSDMAWFVPDVPAASVALERGGFRTRDQEGTVISGGAVPPSNLVDDCPMIWSLPEDTGLTYEFYDMGRRHWAKYSQKADPRLDERWRPDVVRPDDPLGVVRADHHTVETTDRERASRLFVDTLGATEVERRYDDVTDSDVTVIDYAKSRLWFATPRARTLTDVLTGAPTEADQYTGITWAVVDLAPVRARLDAVDVPFDDADDLVSTDPAASLGARWGFTTAR
jgi:catechol 2,3-dioxygenase-like lactoylglutathione lyase family enzyme